MTDLRATATVDKRQRLHPLSPILRSLKAIGVIIAAISWQGFEQFGVYTVLIGVAAAAFVGLVWSWIAWHFMGYTIIGTELHISDGVISRRQRTIPLQRLQSVEVVQPFVGRLLGLAELRCEVVGATKSEAPLAYLSLPEAQALRQRLLALAQDETAATSDTSDKVSHTGTEHDDATAIKLAAVPVKRLVLSQLLTVNVFFLPFAATATVAMFVWQPDMSLLGIAGFIAATAGVLLAPVRKAMVDYDFTLNQVANGFRIRKGLTERTTQTLPINRVTAVAIQWPFLWRRPAWVSSTVTHAGKAQTASEAMGSTLLPVATEEEADRVLSHVFRSVTLATKVSPVPRRARWLAPFAWRFLGAGFAPDAFVSRSGRITRNMVVTPYERIQSVRVVQGRLQRILNVATVHVDIAGGAGLARAEHRDVEDALHMAQALRDNAREAVTARGRRDVSADMRPDDGSVPTPGDPTDP